MGYFQGLGFSYDQLRDCRVCLECRDFHRITGLASGSMPVAVGICFLVCGVSGLGLSGFGVYFAALAGTMDRDARCPNPELKSNIREDYVVAV